MLGGLVNGDVSTNLKGVVHRTPVGRRPNLLAGGDLIVDYSTTANSTSPYSGVGTYAINASLDACMPLKFTGGLGGALAGRPIAIRYVDNRELKQPATP